MQSPKLTLIIAYTYNNDENRFIALTQLMKDIQNQTYRNFEIIVVEDTQGKESVFPYKDKVDKIISITDPQNRKFNKSWVMNVGARDATTEHLLFIDAEMSFGTDYLQKIVDFIPDKVFFNGWVRYWCEVGRDNPRRRIHYFDDTLHAMVGCFYSTKDFFFNKLGGYCEDFFGYGGEDNEIYIRAKFILNKIPALQYTIIHQYHHWHPESSHDPLNPSRHAILTRTDLSPKDVINKLVNSKIGNKWEPTLTKARW